jgi:hypothetical protein
MTRPIYKLLFITLLIFIFANTAFAISCLDLGASVRGIDYNNRPIGPPYECFSTEECIKLLCFINSNPNVSSVQLRPYGP